MDVARTIVPLSVRENWSYCGERAEVVPRPEVEEELPEGTDVSTSVVGLPET